MSAVWKKDVENSVAIDIGKEDIYGLDGATFEFGYFSPDGSYTKLDNVEEKIKTVEANSCLADGDTVKGSIDIKVKDKDDNNKVSNFNKGDVIKVKDKEIYFYVENVDTDNNIITARRPISGDIADGDELDRVGNTAIYATSFKLDEVGIYFVVISNPSINLMNRSTKIEVIEFDEDDTNKKLKNIESVVNSMNDKLDVISGIDGVVIA